MSRRKGKPPVIRGEASIPTVTLVCTGQARRAGSGHRRYAIAAVSLMEDAGPNVEYLFGTTDAAEGRLRNTTTADGLPDVHLTHLFKCRRCPLEIPLKDATLQGIVERVLAAGLREWDLSLRP